MAYSENAIEARRCTATRTDGTPCRASAAWGDPPTHRLTTPAGTHGEHRNARRSFPGLWRLMRRYGWR